MSRGAGVGWLAGPGARARVEESVVETRGPGLGPGTQHRRHGVLGAEAAAPAVTELQTHVSFPACCHARVVEIHWSGMGMPDAEMC